MSMISEISGEEVVAPNPVRKKLKIVRCAPPTQTRPNSVHPVAPKEENSPKATNQAFNTPVSEREEVLPQKRTVQEKAARATRMKQKASSKTYKALDEMCNRKDLTPHKREKAILKTMVTRERHRDKIDRAQLNDFIDTMDGGRTPEGKLPKTLAKRVRHAYARNKKNGLEFVLDTLAVFKSVGLSNDEIAKRFEVSTTTVYRWNHKLSGRAKQRVDKLNKQSPYVVIGEHMETYEAMSQMGFKLMCAKDASHTAIRAGAQIADLALQRKIEYLTRLGYYKNYRLTPPQTVEPKNKKVKRVLAQLDAIDAIVVWHEGKFVSRTSLQK